MTNPPTLADLAADPGELDVSCLDCHHNTTMPVSTLLPRYAAETPFPEVWGRFPCSACGLKACGRSAELGGPPGGRADNPAIAAGPAAHRTGLGAPPMVVAVAEVSDRPQRHSDQHIRVYPGGSRRHDPVTRLRAGSAIAVSATWRQSVSLIDQHGQENVA
jgi:hypothetical protein